MGAGCVSLIQTTPARSARAVRIAFVMSFVQTAAAKPYSLSFASATTSSTASNGITDMTGPKISSRAILAELSTSAKTVGGTK